MGKSSYLKITPEKTAELPKLSCGQEQNNLMVKRENRPNPPLDKNKEA